MKEDLKPARETKMEVLKDSDNNSEEVFAVCLETDNSELLIPFKVYRIKLRGEYVRVIDEKGDVAVYPKSFFLPLQLASEAINTLSTAYAQSV